MLRTPPLPQQRLPLKQNDRTHLYIKELIGAFKRIHRSKQIKAGRHPFSVDMYILVHTIYKS
jgi:hypothetical protein